MTSSTQPISKIKLGSITASIWENDADSDPWYNVTLARVYFDNSNAEFKVTQNLNSNDLLIAAEVLRAAFLKISKLKEQSKSQ